MSLKGLKSVKDAIERLELDANDKVRAIMFQALGNIQAGTPVDTGRARNNWFISVNSPSNKITDSRSGNELNIDMLPKIVIGKKVIYTNNLPYIERLEYSGHSKQAPRGWVRSELIRAKRALRKL